jgi:LysR family hydrogen peroxide-inducible transcriptional activator
MIALPSLRQLRHLVALHETGNFGRAAEAMLVTQSTLSASIKELETVLDAHLVDRTRRRVVFTPLGEEVVARSRRLLADAEGLVHLVASRRDPLSGDLRLGVIPTIAPYLLPRVLPDLRRRFPKLKLFLTEDQTGRLIEALDAGQLDLCLVALPCDCGGGEVAPLFTDRFRLACRADDPLAGSAPLAPSALPPERLLLLQEGHCLREQALSACGLPDRGRREAFAATSLLTLVQMVEGGLGLTLVPELAVGAGLLKGTDLVTRPLAGDAERTIGLTWRRGTARRAEFDLLAAALRAAWESGHGGVESRR